MQVMCEGGMVGVLLKALIAVHDSLFPCAVEVSCAGRLTFFWTCVAHIKSTGSKSSAMAWHWTLQ
jgi:hypothetical protein